MGWCGAWLGNLLARLGDMPFVVAEACRLDSPPKQCATGTMYNLPQDFGECQLQPNPVIYVNNQGPDDFFNCIVELYNSQATQTPALTRRMENIVTHFYNNMPPFTASAKFLRNWFMVYLKEKAVSKRYMRRGRGSILRNVIRQRVKQWNADTYEPTDSDEAVIKAYADEMSKPGVRAAGPVEFDIASALFDVEIQQYERKSDGDGYQCTAVYHSKNPADPTYSWPNAAMVSLPPWQIVCSVEGEARFGYVQLHLPSNAPTQLELLEQEQLQKLQIWAESVRLNDKIRALATSPGTMELPAFRAWYSQTFTSTAFSLRAVPVYLLFVAYLYYTSHAEAWSTVAEAAAEAAAPLPSPYPADVLGSPSMHYWPLHAPADNGSVVDAVFANAERCNKPRMNHARR